MDLIDILLSRKLNKGGGGGGTTNYNQLSNKPKINNIELSGNKTLEALGIGSADDVTTLKTALSDLDSDVSDLQTDKADKTQYVTLSGTQVTQVGADNTMYLCGELAELTFTAPATGITAIRFTSGTTPTVVTLNGITMPDDWTGACETNKRYDICVLNGDGLYSARTAT